MATSSESRVLPNRSRLANIALAISRRSDPDFKPAGGSSIIRRQAREEFWRWLHKFFPATKNRNLQGGDTTLDELLDLTYRAY